MDIDIFDGKLGDVGQYDVEFKGGKLLAKVDVATGPFSAGVLMSIDANKVVDAIEKAIPGQIDDAVLEVLRKFLIGT